MVKRWGRTEREKKPKKMNKNRKCISRINRTFFSTNLQKNLKFVSSAFKTGKIYRFWSEKKCSTVNFPGMVGEKNSYGMEGTAPGGPAARNRWDTGKSEGRGESHESEPMGGAVDGRGDLCVKRRGGGCGTFPCLSLAVKANKNWGKGGRILQERETPEGQKQTQRPRDFGKSEGSKERGIGHHSPYPFWEGGKRGIPSAFFFSPMKTLGEGSVHPVGSAILGSLGEQKTS